MNRILIVRLGSLGDIVHALPVAAALRRAFPLARLDWLVDARQRRILELVTAIDRRIIIGGHLGRADPPRSGQDRDVPFQGWRRMAAAVRFLRAECYDAAFDLQGLVKSAVLARGSGARRVVGFSRPHLRERAAGLFYTEAHDPRSARPDPHVIDKNLGLLAAAGVPAAMASFPLRTPASPVPDLIRARLGIDQSGGFALINPGAAWPNKRWPPRRFGELAALLRARHALPSAVLWGPGEESIADTVAAHSGGAATPAPQTTVGDLIAVSAAAAIMISGDTGPLHVAAAIGTPIVGIYGPTDPARNGPWLPADVVVSRHASCSCRQRRRCRAASACLDDISTGEVLRAVEQRLGILTAHA